MAFEPDPTVIINGVQATVMCVKDKRGTPLLALDEIGNLGITGQVSASSSPISSDDGV
jgi:hypothetical protein